MRKALVPAADEKNKTICQKRQARKDFKKQLRKVKWIFMNGSRNLNLAIILLLSFLFFGCVGTSTQSQSPLGRFDPLSRPRTIYVEVYGYEEYLNNSHPDVFRDAFAYWEARENLTFKLIDKNEIDPKANDQNTIFVVPLKEGGDASNGMAFINWKTHYHEGMYIAYGSHSCRGMWRPYTYNTVLHLTEHEFGHILGYMHNNVSTDLMFGGPGGFGFYRYEIDINESDSIAPGWFFPYSFCSATREPFNDTARVYSFDVSSDRPLDVYVVPSYDEYKKALEGKQFDSIPGCFAKGSTSFKRTCNVTDSSMLFVHHPGSGADPAIVFNIVAQEMTPLAPYELALIPPSVRSRR